MVRRALKTPVPLALSLVAVLATAPPAQAVTLEEKLATLAEFTQPTESSAAAWRDAWSDRRSWADFDFDWSTDGCTNSPDQPLGFDFSIACRRHDFGYRNYQAVGDFRANKEHVDKAFLFDLRQVCAGYTIFRQPSCNALAKLYYQAVRQFGAPRGTGGQLGRVPDRDALGQQGAAESADGRDEMFSQSPPGFFD
ncbi:MULTISPECIES: phospholipase [unclassified Nonomuraea]|uniref:phospholipase n=1 Tax=unclassified Nonomuraea TaxID=2593643 RepID=UPI0033E33F8A